MIKRKGVLCLVLVFLLVRVGSVKAQYDTIRVPLLKYLLQQYDTVLAYTPFMLGRFTPDFYIVCRKQNSVALFTHTNPYLKALGMAYPQEIMRKFIREDMAYKKAPADTGRYFLPFRVAATERYAAWNQMVATGIATWLHAEDIDPGPCRVQTYDGGTEVFYLLTSDSSKVFSFYDGSLFEDECPGNPIRKKALILSQAFKTLFLRR